MSTNKRVLVVAVMTEDEYEAAKDQCISVVGFEDKQSASAACLSTTWTLNNAPEAFRQRVIQKARGE